MADPKKLVIGTNELYALQVSLIKELDKNSLLTSEKTADRIKSIEDFWKKNAPENRFRFSDLRTASTESFYPYLDNKPTTWSIWLAELKKLKDSPLSVTKRLGLSTKGPGITGGDREYWNSVVAKITGVTGSRKNIEANNYLKLLEESKKSNKVIDLKNSTIEPSTITEDWLKETIKKANFTFPDSFQKQVVYIISDNVALKVDTYANYVQGVTPTKTFSLTSKKEPNIIYVAEYNEILEGNYFFDIGHPESDAAKRLKKVEKGYKENLNKVDQERKLSDGAKVFLKTMIQNQLTEIQQQIADLDEVDRSDFEFIVDGVKKIDLYGVPLTPEQNADIAKQLAKNRSPYLKIVEIITVNQQVDSIVVKEDVTITVPFNNSLYSAEFEKLNNLKSGYQKAALFRLEEIVRTPMSPTAIVKAITSNILAIFNSKTDGERYLSRNKSKKRLRRETKIKLPKSKKLNINRKIKTKAVKYKNKNRLVQRNILLSKQQTTLNIVPLINAEIYKYVRAQMSENTLQYRTGEFARSVRVLSAQENAAVQYTYKKKPYSDVFSPGKSYLATEDRNPAKIIDAAIKRLGQDRFQKVFRTEEV